MSPRKQAASQHEWETAIGAGFPPIWSPEEGEMIEVSISRIKESSLKEGKKTKKNFLLECVLVGNGDGTFTRGSGKNKAAVDVEKGELVSLPLSSGIIGESADDERIAFQVNEKANPGLTRFGAFCVQNRTPLRFTYKGKAAIGGGRTFKTIIVQAPKGTLENARNWEPPIDKRAKK